MKNDIAGKPAAWHSAAAMSIDSPQSMHWFRNSAPYINAHRNKTFVLVFGGDGVEHSNFASIIHDIALLNSLGVKLILIHGARKQIDQRLQSAGHKTQFHNGIRVTDQQALEHVKDAAGNLRSQFEALLSMGLPNSPMQGASIRVCSGNFVTARPTGVVNGVDFQHTGLVRSVDADAIRLHLEAGSVVLMSPLGYSPTGEIFNLSLEDVAVRTGAAVNADKMILFGDDPGILNSSGDLVPQCDLSAALELMRTTESDHQRALLGAARAACTAGVRRCHVISYADCALLQELFTHDGSGTLVAQDDYEQARAASIDDVGGILELIEPLEQSGVLVKRSRELLETEINHFRVLERDGRIIACAALYPFTDSLCGEIACVVTHPDYRGQDRGERLLSELEGVARQAGMTQVFALTTQTAHWFLEQGFIESELDQLPDQKQSMYNLQRNSKVLLKTL